ncbi:hypothetical protein [Sorangium sp. So ce861]|uniref:hypothetical protein n=1 Tax=Sorangium sp. So ce861 TaxID=3133323 RepID=UPI003F5F950F
MAHFSQKLRPILDMLASKAWTNAARDQDGEFLLPHSDLAPGTSVESLHETLQVLYRHARRWAPGLEVPFFVPPIRLDVADAAGNFVVDEESYASVGVAAEFVGNPAAILVILSHEACHHILMQSGLKRADDAALDEITTDLAMFVCGFGELVLRGHSQVHRYGSRRDRVHLGYLSSHDYQQAYDHVLAKRVALGLPAHSRRGARAGGGPVLSAPSRQQAADGTVELWCGEAICKRAFRVTLRREGDPWPVQCPACGVYLYPSDVLRTAAASELEPQRAELRLQSGGRLAEVTSAALWRLAHPTGARAAASTRPAAEARAPRLAPSTGRAKVDGAAVLEEILGATPQTADTPAAPQRPAPPSLAAAWRIPILLILLVLVLITASILLSGR